MRSLATILLSWICCLVAKAQYSPRAYLLSDAMKQAEQELDYLAVTRLDECLGESRTSDLVTGSELDTLDWRLDRFLLALSYEDKQIRLAGSATGYQIDSVDKSVWPRMLTELEANGFPKRKSISRQASLGLQTIIWHNVRKSPEAWNSFQPVLREALGDLNVLPWEYAQMVDAYRYRYLKQTQVYNTFNNELVSEDLTEVNRSRLELGLRPRGWTVEEILGYCGCE